MSRPSIGGPLDLNALAALSGANSNSEEARMRHFHALDPQQQAQAIARLAATGLSDYDIAAATAMHVEQVREVLRRHA
jgi:DNA-binding NarL/FixJ family response regulator